MESNALLIFAVSLVCLAVIDLMIVGDLYVVWIKKRRIEKEIIKWRGTKKPLYWFIGWSLGVAINLVLFIALSLAFGTREWVALSCLIAVILCLLYFIAYNITYRVLKSKLQ